MNNRHVGQTVFLLSVIAAMLIGGCVHRAQSAPAYPPRRDGVKPSQRIEWNTPTNWHNGAPLINTQWLIMSSKLRVCIPPWTGDPLLSSNWVYLVQPVTGAVTSLMFPVTNGTYAAQVTHFVRGELATNEADWSPPVQWINEVNWPAATEVIRFP